MIFVDTTKSAAARHRSGLVRVTSRLATALGAEGRAGAWTAAATAMEPADWFFTAEVFDESERTGFSAFLDRHRGRTAALFHDAIPLKLPQITWPQSVARHPAYLRLLARFDRVFAVSQASKTELEGFWHWAGMTRLPPVQVLALGADFDGRPREGGADASALSPNAADRPVLLCVGIVEPRKNQSFLLEVCERLWAAGADFELHVVGRLNPHFGEPIARRIRRAARETSGRVIWHARADDATLRELYRRARATVFPTIAEGCGLPLLESLWMGVPCVCSDLPVLRENADGGGCVPVPVNSLTGWTSALTRVLANNGAADSLRAEARARVLPTWANTAATLRAALR